MIFDPSAFDFLEGKGQHDEGVDIRRTSLLLRFDPLCQQQLLAEKPKAVPALNDLREEEPIPEDDSPLLKLSQTLPASPGIQITAKSIKVSCSLCEGWPFALLMNHFVWFFAEE